MTSGIGDKSLGLKILHSLDKAGREHRDSLEKLSSGQVFTAEDPRPSDRAFTERLEQKLRSLSASKNNINDAVSLLQMAESGFSEVSNMLIRMKEINTAAANSTLGNTERKYLFIEHEALRNEINRIAKSTEYNGIPLLNGQDERTPERLILRIDEGLISNDSQNNNAGEIKLDGMKQVVLTSEGLGLNSAADYLESEDGVDLSTAQELMEPYDTRFSSIYDEALDKVSNFRATYGALQTRLNRAIEYNEVISENIMAAKSRIADVDYAETVSKLTQSNIMLQTNTALLAQNNISAGTALRLIQSLSSS